MMLSCAFGGITMINELLNLESLGYVRSSRHSTLPLTVWKYTAKCQYEKAFGDYPILRKARGLILHDDGTVVATSYEKFFNYSEMSPSELPLGAKNFTIETKLDGSCLIVFRFENQVVYSTLGSFNSEQALLGEKLFKNLYSEDWIDYGYTYLFELIGPSNRIVNYYESDDLILHGIINTSTGLDAETNKPFKKVKQHDFHGEFFGHELYQKLLSLNIPNEEGFVLKVKEPGLPTWMCKIKFLDYCRLHSIMTNFSSNDVWEYLRENKSFDEILELIPDEMNDWIRKTKEEILANYNLIESEAQSAYNCVHQFSTRKDQAVELMRSHKKVAPIVFKMLDGQSYSELIWNIVKPNRVCPFENKNKGEE